MEKSKLSKMDIADISSITLEKFYEFDVYEGAVVPEEIYPILKELLDIWNAFTDKYLTQVHDFFALWWEAGFVTRDSIMCYLDSPAATRISEVDRRFIVGYLNGQDPMQLMDLVKVTFIEHYVGQESLNSIVVKNYGEPIE